MNIEEIWLEYRSTIKRFLHSKVSNEMDVEDLHQEILIKTYANLHTIKDQNSIKSWLFQIANHSIIDFYRRKDRHHELTADELWLLDEHDEVKDELSNFVAPFIHALPSEHAKLLDAIDLQGKPQKAYAKELGITYSTLKSRVQKSRRLLKGIFDDCCHFKMDKNGSIYDYTPKSDQCGDCK